MSGEGAWVALRPRHVRWCRDRLVVQHLLRHDIARASQYQRILAIPSKKARSRPAAYFEPAEAKMLLSQPDRRTPAGARDHALLLFLYNTGTRVCEALAVRPEDLRLLRPPHVRVLGKGHKERICPLWSETATALRTLLSRPGGVATAEPIFRSRSGTPPARDGEPMACHIVGNEVFTSMAALRYQVGGQ